LFLRKKKVVFRAHWRSSEHPNKEGKRGERVAKLCRCPWRGKTLYNGIISEKPRGRKKEKTAITDFVPTVPKIA